jgi:hypothetical protein
VMVDCRSGAGRILRANVGAATSQPCGSSGNRIYRPGGAPLRVVMNGNRLDIEASVDLEGLKKLQTMLEIEMMQLDAKNNKERGRQLRRPPGHSLG